MPPDLEIEAAAKAIFDRWQSACDDKHSWDRVSEHVRCGCRRVARAAIETLDAVRCDGWMPIESAPPLERVFVAGIQPASMTGCAAYWWYCEDVTDNAGVPMDHPDAIRWRPLPPPPKEGT